MLFESIFCGFWALNLVYAVCEFPQRICDEYNGINATLCQIDWHLAPIEIQRMLLIIFLYTQQPLEIQFFGSFSCSREQFKRVSVSHRPIHFITNLLLLIVLRWWIKVTNLSWFFVKCTSDSDHVHFRFHLNDNQH